jgi:beta-barrel assembly-enhancing protease
MNLTPVAPHAKLSRRCLICGAGAFAALATLPAGALPAAADAHDQERQIGQQVYNDQRSKGLIVDTSPYYSTLRNIGANISQAAAPHWYTMNFIIVKDKSANAFSVPGGNIYVTDTLLRDVENEEELANVLGHETGHLVLGHVMDRVHKAQTANIIGTILSVFIRNQTTATMVNLLGNYAFLNFSRAQEYQADHEGVILASKANYNPWGMIWFFQKLEKLYGNAGFEQYVQDHPATNDRIARIEQFFNSDPAQFGKWQNVKTVTSGLSQTSANDTLILH